VTFAIRSGTGSISSTTATTNSVGIASVSWTLGMGANSLTASVPGLNGSPVIFTGTGLANVQIVTFGDSNTDFGFSGVDPTIQVSSYISSVKAPRLSSDAPNSQLQLAGKIESRWIANRPAQTVKAVNHGIGGTSTNDGINVLTSPNGLHVVNGVTRFAGEVLGAGYPWSGGELPSQDFYPNGPILRVQAFTPRSSDFGYISIGTNDIGEGTPVSTIKTNLEIMVDMWIQAGFPPSHLMITTLPPRITGTTDNPRILALNTMIRAFSAKGIRVIDLASFTFSADGSTWKSTDLHVTNDELHYAESVRNWIADQVVSIMLQETPP
jgi:Lysophospholipase L1 and related esterases